MNKKEIIKLLEICKLSLSANVIFNKRFSFEEIVKFNDTQDKINELIKFVKKQKGVERVFVRIV